MTGEEFRRRRERLAIDQVEAARRLGRDPNFYGRVERGDEPAGTTMSILAYFVLSPNVDATKLKRILRREGIRDAAQIREDRANNLRRRRQRNAGQTP